MASLKKAGENADEIIAEMKQLGEDIKAIDDEVRLVEEKFTNMQMWVPNLPHTSVPIGKDETSNVETKTMAS